MENLGESWWSLVRRREHVQDTLLSQQPKMSWPVMFQGKMQSLPMYSVPLDMPAYRLSNGRTGARQMQYIAEQRKQGRDVGDDFFSNDPDYLPALQAQHKLLDEMVGECGLLAELRNDMQKEPLFVDRSGYVVNGNRRLCAMRKLFREDPKEYARFANVDIALLPPCAPEEIEQLEADLQIAEDTKMEYSWVNKALLLRKRKALGWTPARSAAFYKMDEGIVNQLLLMLDYADRYLQTRHLDMLYEKVEVHEQAFKEIVTQLQRKKLLPTALDKQAFVRTSFLFLDDNSALPGVNNYNKIKSLALHWPQVLQELTTDLDEKTIGSEHAPAPDEDDPIDQLIGSSCHDATLTGTQLLLDSLDGKDGQARARDRALDAIESITRTDRERRAQQDCATAMQSAQTSLRNALVQLRKRIEPSEVPAMRSQLEQITALVQEIESTLK